MKIAFKPLAVGVGQTRCIDDQGRDTLVQAPRANTTSFGMPFEFDQRIVLICHRPAT